MSALSLIPNLESQGCAFPGFRVIFVLSVPMEKFAFGQDILVKSDLGTNTYFAIK